MIKSFLSRMISSGKEQPKRLLAGTDGNLFHTLILAYIRIYLQNQDAKSSKEKSPSSSSSGHKRSRSRKASSEQANGGGGGGEEDKNEEQDPTAVLLSILTIMPKISNGKLEEACIASDLLQFLKIICHQFTNNNLTINITINTKRSRMPPTKHRLYFNSF